jgi:hypothetical protein
MDSDKPARLRVRETESLIAEERLNSLVHHRHVDGAIEQFRREINAVARGSTGSVRGRLEGLSRRFSHD